MIITYLLVNKVTGDTYVGRTKQSFSKRMRQHRICTSKHNTPLGRSIGQYGWDAFQTEILFEGDKEKEFINFLKPTLNVPYNPPLKQAVETISVPVRCVETGVVYQSQSEAERHIGIRGGVHNVISGAAKTCGGFHWELT